MEKCAARLPFSLPQRRREETVLVVLLNPSIQRESAARSGGRLIGQAAYAMDIGFRGFAWN
ncbi:hypothetical protein K437DRAFT_256002 [Tilletiaria anomala UBC 951]|uniref:Uncharacterized protein n=1 Tax=Tilletiaria anomala (strain ATCC 24038 / CBS 436.72 / UBC 951) TaxID=1037660 RepID=A0A066VZS6_TILAU|nr:uncharacterized protein K437DRAFT_256002 [Tilletiaria anomala UBC 951]KDN46981.1 hypothetical protein K437DRAFT_256002 [Tilletiaria anomala UBC 951]